MVEAIYAIDRVFDAMHGSSNAVLGLVGQPCEKILPTLRQEALRQPSDALAGADPKTVPTAAPCSAASTRQSTRAATFNQRLRLDSRNEITPDMPVLHYRLQEYPMGVIAISDARSLQTELQGFKERHCPGPAVRQRFCLGNRQWQRQAGTQP
nr:hypothetical protein [Pseudomonas sp. BIGb0427]